MSTDDHLLDMLLGLDSQFEEANMPSPRSVRILAKRRMQRIAQREALRDVIQEPPAPGEQIHILSNAKFDFWTWVPEMTDWLGGSTDSLYLSTWTLCRTTVTELFEMADAGKIPPGTIGFLTGLYFKRRETSVYAALLHGLRERGGRYRAFPNHAKVLLLANATAGHWLTVEGSANLTSNPRSEQYVITNDQTLYEFYREWFEEVLAEIPLPAAKDTNQ